MLPELEGGGSYLIRAMRERKCAFPYDVFPNCDTAMTLYPCLTLGIFLGLRFDSVKINPSLLRMRE